MAPEGLGRAVAGPLLRVACLAAIVAAAALPAAASASTTQEAIFQDDALLTARGVTDQVPYLNEMFFELGADTIHAIVYWGQYAPRPTSARKPRGDASKPSFYSPEKWDVLDSLVRETHDRGMSLILSPAGAAKGSTRIRVPRWARNGASPKVEEFQSFVRALGSRYTGRYDDENSGGSELPRVSRWGIWNEPNISGWLQPQWRIVAGKSVPYGPLLYRQLYDRARRALQTTGHRTDKIYVGEFAPLGRNRRGPMAPIAPGRFLREMVCLDDSLRPYRGAEARRRKCSSHPNLLTDGIAHHVYTEGKGQSPTFRGGPDVFPIGNLAGFESLVKKIAARGRISRGVPFLNTEFGFQSNPPDRVSGVTLAEQAQYENESEYLQYKRPLWGSYTHYLLIDDACFGPRCAGFQTGLRRANMICGEELCRKPAYDAYRLPIVVRSAGGRVRVWGANRPGGQGSQVEILVNGTTQQTVAISSPRGYFDVSLAGSGEDTFQLRDPATGATSRVARVSRGIF